MNIDGFSEALGDERGPGPGLMRRRVSELEDELRALKERLSQPRSASYPLAERAHAALPNLKDLLDRLGTRNFGARKQADLLDIISAAGLTAIAPISIGPRDYEPGDWQVELAGPIGLRAPTAFLCGLYDSRGGQTKWCVYPLAELS